MSLDKRKSGKTGGAVPGIRNRRKLENVNVEAHQRQIQARPPHGRERLRTAQEPGQSPRIWPRAAWTTTQGQAQRLWNPASRQAEAQGILRRHHREAVQIGRARSIAANMAQGSMDNDARASSATMESSFAPSRILIFMTPPPPRSS